MNRKIVCLLSCFAVAPHLGCLKTDKQEVKAASWQGDKRPEDGKPVKEAPAPRIAPATHLASGRMLEQQNDLRGAINQYERALAASPTLVEAYNRLGIVYQKLEQFDEAEKILKKGVRIAPESAMLHNNLGYCFLVQGKYQPAEREFRGAVAIAPNFDRARMNLAIVLAKTERTEESVREFSHVVPAEVAYYNVAVICVQQSRYQEAADALHRCLKINPDYLPARAELDNILAMADAARGPDKVHVQMAGDADDESIDIQP